VPTDNLIENEVQMQNGGRGCHAGFYEYSLNLSIIKV